MQKQSPPHLALVEVGKKFDLRRSRLVVAGSEFQLEPADEEEEDEYEEGGRQDRVLTSRWALKGVTFSVAQGERVAVIGRNGSGKSTLLKIVGGLCVPTEGAVSGSGCVVPLNSVLSPFQPTASGLGNIRILCQILRIDIAVLKQHLNEIVAFSELGDRVHDRISTYSRGMYGRLAAAAALHLEPDILLIDGGFSVGDHAFRQKVDARLLTIVQNGAILLYASHKLSALQDQCDRAIWLEGGHIQADGPVEEVVGQYSSVASPETEVDAAEDRQADPPSQLSDSSAYRAWLNPPARTAGPKLIGQGEGRMGKLVSFALCTPDGRQPDVFDHSVEIMCVAVVETVVPNVAFDAQLDVWAGKAHAVLARPTVPFHIDLPGRHRITATLDSRLLPDNIYSAVMRISFINDKGSGQELALGTREFFVSGNALKDERRRRFESMWPPKRLRAAFLEPDLHWQALPVREDAVVEA